jgi:hypothetical protein
MREYFDMFVLLLAKPFDQFTTAWGILPIYTSLLLGEMYKSKVSFGHAVGNGFVMLWAGLNWARHLSHSSWFSHLISSKTLPWIVTAACIALGLFTIVLGIRKKDKALCEILGHTRFSCYFLILFYPMQAGLMKWSWHAVAAILIFALPCWFLIYGLGRVARRLIK